ncbi:MAG: peptidylprolyl isomerase [Alphaproteobacteria bacterium]
MGKPLKFLSFLVISLGLSAPVQALDLENTLYLQLKTGRVTILMRPDLAPMHVERIKELVRAKFYDGHKFHRVIKGFMAQTGDPYGDGTGGSGKEIEAEFTDVPFLRGTAGMARSADPNSADSQWFITFYPTRHLNGQYTVWGRVVEGMEHVDAIKKGRGPNGKVKDPDHVIAMRVAADVETGKETLPTELTQN